MEDSPEWYFSTVRPFSLSIFKIAQQTTADLLKTVLRLTATYKIPTICQAQEEIALSTPFGEVICPASKWQGTLKPTSLLKGTDVKRGCISFLSLKGRPSSLAVLVGQLRGAPSCPIHTTCGHLYTKHQKACIGQRADKASIQSLLIG